MVAHSATRKSHVVSRKLRRRPTLQRVVSFPLGRRSHEKLDKRTEGYPDVPIMGAEEKAEVGAAKLRVDASIWGTTEPPNVETASGAMQAPVKSVFR
jgi:hypothetical protein